MLLHPAYKALINDRRLDRITLCGGGCMGRCSVGLHLCAAESDQGLWEAVCCRQPACAVAAVLPGGRAVPALADFSHTFLHCPAACPAVQGCVTRGPASPRLTAPCLWLHGACCW
jgi:hypothetical protein